MMPPGYDAQVAVDNSPIIDCGRHLRWDRAGSRSLQTPL